MIQLYKSGYSLVKVLDIPKFRFLEVRYVLKAKENIYCSRVFSAVRGIEKVLCFAQTIIRSVPPLSHR